MEQERTQRKFIIQPKGGCNGIQLLGVETPTERGFRIESFVYAAYLRDMTGSRISEQMQCIRLLQSLYDDVVTISGRDGVYAIVEFEVRDKRDTDDQVIRIELQQVQVQVPQAKTGPQIYREGFGDALPQLKDLVTVTIEADRTSRESPDVDWEVRDAEARLPKFERERRQRQRDMGMPTNDRCQFCRAITVGMDGIEWTAHTGSDSMQTFRTCVGQPCKDRALSVCDASYALYTELRMASSGRDVQAACAKLANFTQKWLRANQLINEPADKGWGESVLSRAYGSADPVAEAFATQGITNVDPNGFAYKALEGVLAWVDDEVARLQDVLTATVHVDGPDSAYVEVIDKNGDVVRGPKISLVEDHGGELNPVDAAIAAADGCGALPGSKTYMATALGALPGVTSAAVYDCHDEHRWVTDIKFAPGQFAVVIDYENREHYLDIAEVIDATRTVGTGTIAGTEHVAGSEMGWFTPIAWRAFLNPSWGALEYKLLTANGSELDFIGRRIGEHRTAVVELTYGKRLLVAVGATDATGGPPGIGTYVEVETDYDYRARLRAKLEAGPGHIYPFDPKTESQYDTEQRPLGINHIGLVDKLRVGDGSCRIYGADDLEQVKADFGCGSDAYRQAAELFLDTGHKPTTDPMDVKYDDVTLRELLNVEAAARHELGNVRLTPAQRAAVSAYQSAHLRELLAKAETERKAKEPSVVITIDPEDL